MEYGMHRPSKTSRFAFTGDVFVPWFDKGADISTLHAHRGAPLHQTQKSFLTRALPGAAAKTEMKQQRRRTARRDAGRGSWTTYGRLGQV